MRLTHSSINGQLAWEPTAADIGALLPVTFTIDLEYKCEACETTRSNRILIGGFTSHDTQLLIEGLRKSTGKIIASVSSLKICYGCTKPSMVDRIDQNGLALYLTNNLTPYHIQARIRELGAAPIYRGELAS